MKISFSLVKRKKNTMNKIRWIVKLFRFSDVPPHQKLPNAQHTHSHYFLDMFKFLVIIFQTHHPFSCSADLRSFNQLMITIPHFIHLMLTSVLFVEGLPFLESSFTSSWLSLDLLCYSKTHVCKVMLSPYNWWSISILYHRFPSN